MFDEINTPSNVVPFKAAADKPKALRVVENGEVVAIELYGDIGAWELPASYVIDTLKAADGEGKTVEIRINSAGGDVFEGVAISNAEGRMKAHTIAIVDGLAASIASLIAVSADELHMPSNAFLMVHNAWSVVAGNSSELRATAEVLDKIDEMLAAQYTAKAARTLGAEAAEAIDFRGMMAAEAWLTAEEAAAVGLCDVVLEPVQIAAAVRPDIAARYRNTPAEIVASADDAQENEAEVEVEPEVEAEEPEPEVEVEEELDPAYVAEIRTLCALADKPEMADGFIQARTSFDAARAAIWDKRAAEDEAEIDNSQPVVTESERPRDRMNEIRKNQYARFSGKQ